MNMIQQKHCNCPIEKFQQWYREELKQSSLRIPSACCLSSIGVDGYPNARFVSLKEIIDKKFVITGSLNSQKGIELLSNSKAALTFWWTTTERQVRIQGDAVQIEDHSADRYFKDRSTASKIISKISAQGKAIEDLKELTKVFEQQENNLKANEIKRPLEWSGFYILPKRIELMEFKVSRFHLRELYLKENESWTKTILQP